MAFEGVSRRHHGVALNKAVETVASRPAHSFSELLYLDCLQHVTGAELMDGRRNVDVPTQVQVAPHV